MEEKTIYYISEAAKKVQVESHVLRYWEDELELPIMRNEMGHRYYTEQDIRKLQEIKQLKEQGLQLKAIRTILFRMPGKISEKAEDILMQQVSQKTAEKVQETQNMQEDLEGGEPGAAAESLAQWDGSSGQTVQWDRSSGQTTQGDKTSEQSEQPVQCGGLSEQTTQCDSAPDKTSRPAQAKDPVKSAKIQDGDSTETAAEGHEEALKMDMTKFQISEGREQIDIDRPQRFIVALSKDKEEAAAQEPQLDDADRSRKAARLQYLLQHMITEAVKSANRELCTDVKESILKELDYQFRMQEERDEERWKKEEEHYRKIDEMIRERHRPKERLVRGKKKSPVKDDPINL